MKASVSILTIIAFLSISGIVRVQSAQAQSAGAQGASEMQAPGRAALSASSASNIASSSAAQNPLFRGIPSGPPAAGILQLSLKDAVDRGLRFNLGMALSEQNIRATQSSRLRALSALMPHISAQMTETAEQVNLASVGFSGFPGINPIVGPFSVFDIRANLSQSVLNLSQWSQLRAGDQMLRAAEHSNKNTRDMIALVCIQLYMQTTTAASRVDVNQAQLHTAQVLYDLAVNRHDAGFIPGIEVIRAQVQMQAQQQRLILAQNDLAKQKLSLAQAIGLPLGQEFQLSDPFPYAPLEAITIEDALQNAYGSRGDYLSGQAQVKAAEEARQAAVRLKLPTADFNANYGDIGQRPWQSHGTFVVQLGVRVPIFQGGEIESRIQAADAQLAQQKADLESLRARIYYEIKASFLDLKSSQDRVAVAKSNLDLANQQVAQAQDRFMTGVVSNIEVVQAQDALALATEDYLSSVFMHNLAKANLAEAMGVAETDYQKFLHGK
jgi:outer membrane protein TolC